MCKNQGQQLPTSLQIPMRANHDPAIVTLFHSTLEYTLDYFLEFWIFEGVQHFLGLLAQPPTTLLTLPFIIFPPGHHQNLGKVLRGKDCRLSKAMTCPTSQAHRRFGSIVRHYLSQEKSPNGMIPTRSALMRTSRQTVPFPHHRLQCQD